MKKLTITYDMETGELKLHVNEATGGEVVILLITALKDFCDQAFKMSVDQAVATAYKMNSEGELFNKLEEQNAKV